MTNDLKRNGKIIAQKFREYFLPTVLTALANNIAVMVDSVIVGNLLGSNAMSAINLLSPIVQLYFSLTILFGMGASVIIAYSKGKNDARAADRAFTCGFVSIAALSVILMAAQLALYEQIAGALTDIPELKAELIKYYIPFIIGTPFSLALPAAVHCIRSDGAPKLASALIIISNAINLIMDLLLMGVFKTDITGSSVATVIGNIAACAVMLFHFKSKKNTLRFDFSVLKSGFAREFFALFTTGASGALGTLLITVRMFFLNDLIQRTADKEGLAAMSVISMYQIFVSAFITGASQTMVPIVSALYGERDRNGIKYAFRSAVAILMISTAVIVFILEFAAEPSARLFGEKTAEEMAVIVPALRITALSFFGQSLAFLIMYYFTAIKKKALSVIVSISAGAAIIIPCAYWFSAVWGIEGIWRSFNAAMYGTLAVTAICVPIYAKKHGCAVPFLLWDKSDEVISLSASRGNSVTEIEERLAGNVGDAVKIAVLDIFSHFKNGVGPALCDIRVLREDGKTVVYFRSTGAAEEPCGYEQSRTLGMNQIKAKIE